MTTEIIGKAAGTARLVIVMVTDDLGTSTYPLTVEEAQAAVASLTTAINTSRQNIAARS